MAGPDERLDEVRVREQERGVARAVLTRVVERPAEVRRGLLGLPATEVQLAERLLGAGERGPRLAAEGQPEVSIDLLAIASMAFTATAETVTEYLQDVPAPDAVFAFSDTAAMAAIGALPQRAPRMLV